MAIEFPVATCPACNVRGPVFMDNVNGFEVVICPECDTILNSDDDFEIEWFDVEDAKYFGYKVVENE